MIVHVLRKPLVGTVASNALQHGCGALNIDQCRIVTSEADKASAFPGSKLTSKSGALAGGVQNNRERSAFDTQQHSAGRWPANLVHDGDATTVKRFPDCMGGTWNRTDGARPFDNNGEVTNYVSSGSDRSFGSAARFFQQVTIE